MKNQNRLTETQSHLGVTLERSPATSDQSAVLLAEGPLVFLYSLEDDGFQKMGVKADLGFAFSM